MTKKDFEFIAGVLAEMESRTCESPRNVQQAISNTVFLFAAELEKTHPRFKRGLFENAALPIYHKTRADLISARLRNQGDS